jgi:membrane protease YdiL (CAAX protease family)
VDPQQRTIFLATAPQLFLGCWLLLLPRRFRPAAAPATDRPRWGGSGCDAALFFSLAALLLFSAPKLLISLLCGNCDPFLLPFFSGTPLAIFLALLLLFNGLSFRLGCSPRRFSLRGGTLRGAFHYLRAVPLIFLTEILWLLLLTALAAAGLPIPMEQQELVLRLQRAPPLAAAAAAAAATVAAPFAEEILFRGAAYRYLKSVWGSSKASIVTAFLFAALHGNLCAFLPLFLLGTLLVRCYEREGNILPCIIFHSLFNLNSVLLSLAVGAA